MVFILHVFAYDTWADCSVKFLFGTPCSQMAFHHYVIAYVSSGHSPGHIMPHTFLGMCCYKGPLMASCTTLFSADYFFSPVCILLCCFRLPLLTNPAPHSLQINCFPPVCVCIQHFSWLQSYTAAQVDRQSLGRSALPYTPYTLPV